ncbi:hypothetical protein JYU34_002034 [Plutella xylostella]|uniref:AN1-type zinc finger protein 4 n=1 Tax=Plutella xylostella TaxID=51655 RepID=A0ABQ7R5I2_PLUXY|nr:hypothetical protein JYU34_002034 [Plutella xylostella]
MSQHGCPERLPNRSKGFPEEGAGPTMELLVETLTGTAFEMTVSPSDTVHAIKSKIYRVEGIPISQQHLLYNLKELDDASSLHELSICDGARLRLVLGLRGGPVSTRRLPPPPASDANWRDIERLLDGNRDGGGCKVTVLVFRDGERVNMLRVRENHDGTYSPLDPAAVASPPPRAPAPAPAPAHHDNAVTLGKMRELRRRLDSLSVQRARPRNDDEKPEPIQKTRSEETLSVPSLLDEAASYSTRDFSYDDDAFTPLYDGSYTKYDYDCSFADRYTLLPPIGSRTDSEETIDSDRLKLSDALSGSILVKSGRREGRDEEAAILEESVSFDGSVEECLRQEAAAKNLAPISADNGDYGPLTFGRRARLHLLGVPARAPSPPPAPPRAPPRPPRAPLSSSTPDLDARERTRILPQLSRYKNREHLHLSDEGLSIERPLEVTRLVAAPAPAPPAPAPAPARRVRCGFCRKRLSIATAHRCRCGATYCAPHRYAEVHGCAYDYKAERAHSPPRLQAPKLPKI